MKPGGVPAGLRGPRTTLSTKENVMCLDATLTRMEAQLGSWKVTLKHDQADAFHDVASLGPLFRELRTAGCDRVAAIKLGLESAWRDFNSAVRP